MFVCLFFNYHSFLLDIYIDSLTIKLNTGTNPHLLQVVDYFSVAEKNKLKWESKIKMTRYSIQ